MELREKQKLEAIKRLKMLKVLPNIVKDLEENDVVYYSERQNDFFDGILYWISNDERFVKAVKEFEEGYNALVYHAQLSRFEFGTCLTLLFVSRYEEEWERDCEDLQNGEAYCYVVNLDAPECSECGYCGIKPKHGGVTRTY